MPALTHKCCSSKQKTQLWPGKNCEKEIWSFTTCVWKALSHIMVINGQPPLGTPSRPLPMDQVAPFKLQPGLSVLVWASRICLLLCHSYSYAWSWTSLILTHRLTSSLILPLACYIELPGDHWAVWGHFGGFGLSFNEFSKGSVETFWRTLTVFTGF